MINEKCLVIINSETREYQHTFESFKKYVLEVLNADLALCVAINNRENQDNPFYKEAKYIWQYNEPEDWAEAFDYASEYEGINNDWRIVKSVKDQWLGGIKGENAQKGSAGILLFFRWFTKIKLLEDNLINKYDRFIFTRSDYLYETPHIPLKFLPRNKIWIPQGEDYGGVTDRYMLCSSSTIIPALSIVDSVLKTPHELVEEMSFSDKWNLEQFIKFSFQKIGIWNQVERFPRFMYSLRSKDGHTRWEKGKFNQSLGYYIKYKNEYSATLITKRIFNNLGKWDEQSFKKAQKRIRKLYFWDLQKNRFFYFLSLIGINIKK